MSFKRLAAAMLALMIAVPADAATLDFNFSFTGTFQSEGLVTGIIRGLTDNATSSASSVEVLTAAGGFGMGEYVLPTSIVIYNTFTVTSGAITDWAFSAFEGGSVPSNNCCSLAFFSQSFLRSSSAAGLSPNRSLTVLTEVPGLAFTPAVSAVPLPAGGWLLLTGLAGVAALKRRKQIAA